eukprot:CAMPEP_0172169020 /NCGR_PEP_ID=MMETSP1050-20130122/10472_1 /TAXON_ID=233186 /ORGANISM="Cryptomonas curvata, Strain CCAP979/52" /LENGTH=113 /DNA_ID=CAMNT_0012840029 /DNA_START=28 /DNA_END=365 /DNA_ORIENTATION=-
MKSGATTRSRRTPRPGTATCLRPALAGPGLNQVRFPRASWAVAPSMAEGVGNSGLGQSEWSVCRRADSSRPAVLKARSMCPLGNTMPNFRRVCTAERISRVARSAPSATAPAP